jgi:hypothetical protein
MPRAGNPWDIPEWHSIGREAALVRQLIGSGITALGRASYADQIGEYYTAFFGLSVGLERLAKLILVADYSIANNGHMPAEQIVRKFGHKLTHLMNVIAPIVAKHNLKLDFPRPSGVISTKIVECLDAFADAGRGRYANFAALGDPNLGEEEPIRKWWGEVAEAILGEYYYGKPIQLRVEGRASAIDALMSPFSLVLHINEAGDAMEDVRTSSIRTGQTDLVQRHGRYFALTIVRWLAEVFSALSQSACYTYNIKAFFGVNEYFQTYTVEDRFLKKRKVWP